MHPRKSLRVFQTSPHSVTCSAALTNLIPRLEAAFRVATYHRSPSPQPSSPWNHPSPFICISIGGAKISKHW